MTDMMMAENAGPEILARPGGASIAYHRINDDATAQTKAGKVGVVFIHGFHSDMAGGKALALEQWCRQDNRAFIRFDLFGHGQSSGRVEDGCVTRWAEDAVAVLDQLTVGPQIVVGSSLGGWVALLAALARRDRVAGLVGLAAAPDFTEDLMWAGFSDAQRRQMLEHGQIQLDNCYDPANPWIIPRLLIEDGRRNLLLRDAINLMCPVRLIQGQRDDDVPWKTALAIADCLAGDDVRVHLVKDGGHRLSRDSDIALICQVVENLARQVDGDD